MKPLQRYVHLSIPGLPWRTGGRTEGDLRIKREEIPGDKCCWRAVTGSLLAVAPISHKERASRPFSAEPGDGFDLRLDNSTFSPARIGLRIAVGV